MSCPSNHFNCVLFDELDVESVSHTDLVVLRYFIFCRASIVKGQP